MVCGGSVSFCVVVIQNTEIYKPKSAEFRDKSLDHIKVYIIQTMYADNRNCILIWLKRAHEWRS